MYRKHGSPSLWNFWEVWKRDLHHSFGQWQGVKSFFIIINFSLFFTTCFFKLHMTPRALLFFSETMETESFYLKSGEYVDLLKVRVIYSTVAVSCSMCAVKGFTVDRTGLLFTWSSLCMGLDLQNIPNIQKFGNCHILCIMYIMCTYVFVYVFQLHILDKA